MIDLGNRNSWPKIGSAWEHRNGNIYRVVMYTNRANERQDEYPTTIVYRNVDNNEHYSRKLSDWERSMTWLTDVPLPDKYLKDLNSETIKPMMLDENGNRSIFDDVDE